MDNHALESPILASISASSTSTIPSPPSSSSSSPPSSASSSSSSTASSSSISRSSPGVRHLLLPLVLLVSLCHHHQFLWDLLQRESPRLRTLYFGLLDVLVSRLINCACLIFIYQISFLSCSPVLLAPGCESAQVPSSSFLLLPGWQPPLSVWNINSSISPTRPMKARPRQL